MGMLSMCPSCGSDWCSNCECVRDQVRAAEARATQLADALGQALVAQAELETRCAHLAETVRRLTSGKEDG